MQYLTSITIPQGTITIGQQVETVSGVGIVREIRKMPDDKIFVYVEFAQFLADLFSLEEFQPPMKDSRP